MPWVKLDDGWYDHPKFLNLGLESIALWVLGLSYSARYLTDGFLPTAAVAGLCRTSDWAAGPLLDEGLWESTDGGWIIHNYHDYQPHSDQIKEQRKARKAAGRAGGLARSKQTVASKSLKQTVEPHPVPLNTSYSIILSERLTQVWPLIADRKCSQSKEPILHPDRWKAKVAETDRVELAAEAERIVGLYPEITVTQLADVLMGQTNVLRNLKRLDTAAVAEEDQPKEAREIA